MIPIKETLLIDQVIAGNITPLALDRHLMELSRTAPSRLTEIFKERNSTGNHLLRWTIDKGDVPFLKILLSFDILNDFSKDKVEEYAKQKVYDVDLTEESKKNHLKVCALIHSRIRWQSLTNTHGVLRSIHAINEALQSIKDLPPENGVMVFGGTGQGKSTFINYQLGVDYRVVRERGLERAVKLNPAAIELALTGSSPVSQTLYPQVFKRETDTIFYVDLPGFEETRGTSEEVASAAATAMLAKRIPLIHSLCVVVSWAALADPKMLSYRNTAESIGRIIGRNPSTQQNIILVITKPDADISMADIIDRLQALVEAEKFDKIDYELSEIYENKSALKITTEAILRRADTNIVIADIRTPAARENMIRAMEFCTPQISASYSFEGYTEKLRAFQRTLGLLCEDFFVLQNQQASLRVQRQELDSTIFSKQTEISALRKKIADVNKTSAPFDESAYVVEKNKIMRMIRTLFEERSCLMTQQAQVESDHRASQREYATLQARYAGEMSYQEMIEIGHRNQKDYQGLEQTVRFFRMGRGLERVASEGQVRKVIVDIAGMDRNDSKGNSLMDGLKKLAQLHKQLEGCGESTIQQSLWNNQDAKRQQEIALAQVQQSLENARAQYKVSVEMANKKFQVLTSELSQCNSKIDSLLEEKKALEHQGVLVQYELEVNVDIFSNIENINRFLMQEVPANIQLLRDCSGVTIFGQARSWQQTSSSSISASIFMSSKK